jgi:hypothetical protein
VRSDDSHAVPPQDFITNQTHCGFCTMTLRVLGLPLTRPTRGNFNYAVHYNYQLPAQLMNDPMVLVRYLNSGRYTHADLKKALNPLLSNDPSSWVLGLGDTVAVDDFGVVNDIGDRLVGALLPWESKKCDTAGSTKPCGSDTAMALYYVQNFAYDGPGSSRMYGEMGAHDHNKANKFSVDCLAYLQSKGCKNIAPGHFMSNQGQPADGKEMTWDDLAGKWEKA